MLPTKSSADFTPEVNLRIPLHAGDKASKWEDPPSGADPGFPLGGRKCGPLGPGVCPLDPPLTLALKHRADISRSPKQGSQWPHKKEWCPPKQMCITMTVVCGLCVEEALIDCIYNRVDEAQTWPGRACLISISSLKYVCVSVCGEFRWNTTHILHIIATGDQENLQKLNCRILVPYFSIFYVTRPTLLLCKGPVTVCPKPWSTHVR